MIWSRWWSFSADADVLDPRRRCGLLLPFPASIHSFPAHPFQANLYFIVHQADLLPIFPLPSNMPKILLASFPTETPESEWMKWLYSFTIAEGKVHCLTTSLSFRFSMFQSRCFIETWEELSTIEWMNEWMDEEGMSPKTFRFMNEWPTEQKMMNYEGFWEKGQLKSAPVFSSSAQFFA